MSSSLKLVTLALLSVDVSCLPGPDPGTYHFSKTVWTTEKEAPSRDLKIESQEQHIDAKSNTATPRESSLCAVGWTEFDHTGKCYKVITNRNSWKNSLSACKSAVSDPSATLASVPDQTTNDFLINLSPSSSVWVGGFKNSDGQWAWSDGSQMTFTNWGLGKPDNCCGGLQDYVVFYPFSQGKWNDLKESKTKRAVCQYDRPTLTVVDGNWGSWGAWSSCSESCGSASRNRSRECNNPAPAHGGQECQGSNKESGECNTKPCQEMIIRTGGRNRATGVALFEADGSFFCELPKLLDGVPDGPPQHRGRVYHTQTGLMACGGTREGGHGNDDGTRGKTCVTFNGGEWIQSKNLTTNRMGHSAWKTSKGVYLIGGREADSKTELITDTGVELQPFNLKLPHFVGCAIGFEDKVILTGGHGATSRVVVYNESGWVEDLPSLNQYRWEHGCGHYINSDNKMVYMVAGGQKGGSGWAAFLDSTEILVEGASSWTIVGAVKPGVRRGPSIINLNNKVFMFGGDGNLPEYILEFNKDTLEWTIIGEKGLGWEGGVSVVPRETADYCIVD